MASLFVHLPFEKNLLNVPLCPLENKGLFLCDLNTRRIRFESFVRLHFNLMFLMNSLVLCSTVSHLPAGWAVEIGLGRMMFPQSSWAEGGEVFRREIGMAKR